MYRILFLFPKLDISLLLLIINLGLDRRWKKSTEIPSLLPEERQPSEGWEGEEESKPEKGVVGTIGHSKVHPKNGTAGGRKELQSWIREQSPEEPTGDSGEDLRKAASSNVS